MSSPQSALLLSLVGIVMSAISPVLGITPEATPVVIPYAQVGGAAAAVAGLVYIARKMSNGELVAYNVQHHDAELMRIIAGQKAIIDDYRKLIEASHRREDEAREMNAKTNQYFGEFSALIRESKR